MCGFDFHLRHGVADGLHQNQQKQFTFYYPQIRILGSKTEKEKKKSSLILVKLK